MKGQNVFLGLLKPKTHNYHNYHAFEEGNVAHWNMLVSGQPTTFNHVLFDINDVLYRRSSR